MILVTGGTGHIGNVLVRELIKRGNSVRTLILKGEDRAPLNGLDVEIVEGDILDIESLERAFCGVDKVFHLAAMISILPGKSEMVHRVNVEGTRNVVEVARRCGVRRLLYTSSIHAIGRPEHGITIDENIPFDPHNHAGEYDRSKAEASLEVLQAVREGLDAVIVCPTGVIGPHDYRKSEIGQLIEDCMHGKPQFCIDGAYDFVDVRDVAQGMILALERGRTGETYILGGERITVRAIYDTIVELTGIRAMRIHVPIWLARASAKWVMTYYRISRTRPIFTPYSLETVLSNSNISWEKANRELGYAPRSLRESINDTIEWISEHRKAWHHAINNTHKQNNSKSKQRS